MSTNPPTAHLPPTRPFMPASPPDISGSSPSQKAPYSHFQDPSSPPLSTSPSHLDSSAIPSPLASDFTPPTSAPMSAQTSQHNPAVVHNVTESSSNQENVDDDVPGDSDIHMQGAHDSEQHFQSNAKRKMERSENDMTSNKRRRTEERELEPTTNADAVEGADPSYGPFPGLCENPLPRSQPHVSQNLIELYNLDDTAASVARFDPSTGAKTNPLYKSYLSKIKDLSGKNKPNVAAGDLLGLMRVGDEDWENTQIRGKEIETGLSDSFMGKVSKAVQLSSTSLPEKLLNEWNSILIDPPTSKRSTPAPSRGSTTQQPSATTGKPATVSNSTAPKQFFSDVTSPTTADALRPKRRGTKRRYDDDSFEGYTDTFDKAAYGDDDESVEGDEDGSSRRGSSSKKKRRKDPSATSPNSFGRNINSHSPVTVGYDNYYGGR